MRATGKSIYLEEFTNCYYLRVMVNARLISREPEIFLLAEGSVIFFSFHFMHTVDKIAIHNKLTKNLKNAFQFKICK